MPLKSRDVRDFDTPYDNEPSPKVRALMRWRHGPDGLGIPQRPMLKAVHVLKELRDRICKLRAWIKTQAVLSDYVERTLAPIDRQLYAVELYVIEQQPVWCCRGVPKGGADGCPACHGQRVATRARYRKVWGDK